MQKLHNSIKDNRDSLNTTTNLEGRIVSDIEAQIQKITSSIKASQPLKQQLQDLEKVKATILERLQATETHLADSRSNSTISEREEKAQLQQSSRLFLLLLLLNPHQYSATEHYDASGNIENMPNMPSKVRANYLAPGAHEISSLKSTNESQGHHSEAADLGS
ncbi:MAG: hypothetical protein Q9205_003838 [Flavoplaca limonia]